MWAIAHFSVFLLMLLFLFCLEAVLLVGFLQLVAIGALGVGRWLGCLLGRM